jgi:hypothetical protein
VTIHQADPFEQVQGLSEKALAERALAVDNPSVSRAAIRELARKRSPRRRTVLTEIVLDDGRDADVRAMAAMQLGRYNTAASRKALLEVVSGSPDAVRRRAVEALGRIGDEESLARLRRLRPRDAVIQRSVDCARALISYRLGLGTDLLEPPTKRRLTAGQRMRPINTTIPAATGRLVKEALADAEEELPALPLSPEGARHLICGANQFVLALSREMHEHKTLAWLGRRNAVLMVVLWKASTLDAFEPYMYVLAHPEREGRLRLLGLRSMGEVTVAGEIELREQSAVFSAHAAETLHQVPMDLIGTYDHQKKTIVFATAVIDSDFARNTKGSRVPRSG